MSDISDAARQLLRDIQAMHRRWKDVPVKWVQVCGQCSTEICKGGDPEAEHKIERHRETCPGPVLLVPVEDDGNVLIFAFARAERAWTSQVAERAAEELQRDLELEFPRFLQRLRMGHLL